MRRFGLALLTLVAACTTPSTAAPTPTVSPVTECRPTIARMTPPEQFFNFVVGGSSQPNLIYTFARRQEEKKVVVSEAQGRRHAAFNTGLVTPKQEEIFAFFEENPLRERTGHDWRLVGFQKESDRRFLEALAERPQLANYFDDPGELLYDRRRHLFIDHQHVLEDNILRFPKALHENRHIAAALLEAQTKTVQLRVYRNYKTAIPQFYKGSIQLLLPLCLEDPTRADLALVVSRVGEHYRGETVLTLDMAYSNARLITKPDDEWLRP